MGQTLAHPHFLYNYTMIQLWECLSELWMDGDARCVIRFALFQMAESQAEARRIYCFQPRVLQSREAAEALAT